MSTVRELHDKATELAQMALVARHEGRAEEATDLTRQALDYEVQAARLVPDGESSEPTRSILYLSAASLAYQCKDLHTAQRLVAEGLSGYPPPKVEEDLQGLFEQVSFERHLKTHGIILDDTDVQISLAGKAVGFGMVIYREFKKRVEHTIELLHRRTEYKSRGKYRKTGRPASVFRPFVPAVSTGRLGSYSVTLRLGTGRTGQLPLLVSASEVIDDVLLGIELVNSSSEESLSVLIDQDAQDAELYRRNFIALTRDMAPDGDRITFVGFTSKNRSVSLTRLQSDIEYTPEVEGVSREVELTPVTVEGVLDHAMSREHKGIERRFIEVNPRGEGAKKIIVDEGMVDVVRQYFGQAVEVRGVSVRDNKGDVSIHLRDIRPVDIE